jgi:large subunit ribosomal protein L3e/syntaxin 6
MTQVLALKRNVEGGRQKSVFGRSSSTNPSESIRSKKNISQDNDEFIASESDQQMLLIK